MMAKLVGIIMVTLQTATHAFNTRAPVPTNTPSLSHSPSPVVYGILLTGLSTQLSLYVVNKAPLPQLERRKVIQCIGCCAAFSTGVFIHESKNEHSEKIESNALKPTQQQTQRARKTITPKNDYLRISRGHLGSRHEFLSQFLQEANPLRRHHGDEGLLRQEKIYQERQAGKRTDLRVLLRTYHCDELVLLEHARPPRTFDSARSIASQRFSTGKNAR